LKEDIMLANTAARTDVNHPTKAPEGAQPDTQVIESRFGTIEVTPEARLHLPNGLLGFAEFHDFGLAMLPGGRHPQFRVLQSLTAQELAFLVAPLNMESCAIEDDDLNEACATLGIGRDRLGVLLIVTVRRDEDGAHVSVNMRAPLFVDTARNIARQYVMPNNKYSIRHTL
jgi:flagellar assembly factor FliW